MTERSYPCARVRFRWIAALIRHPTGIHDGRPAAGGVLDEYPHRLRRRDVVALRSSPQGLRQLRTENLVDRGTQEPRRGTKALRPYMAAMLTPLPAGQGEAETLGNEGTLRYPPFRVHRFDVICCI